MVLGTPNTTAMVSKEFPWLWCHWHLHKHVLQTWIRLENTFAVQNWVNYFSNSQCVRLLFSSLAVVLKTIQLITSMDVWQTSKICWKWTFFFFGLICSDSVSASRLGCIKSLTKVKDIFKKPTHLQRKEKKKR